MWKLCGLRNGAITLPSGISLGPETSGEEGEAKGEERRDGEKTRSCTDVLHPSSSSKQRGARPRRRSTQFSAPQGAQWTQSRQSRG